VVSFGISKLQGTISYAAVLHDGCRFKANNIEIILEPVELDTSTKKEKDERSKRGNNSDAVAFPDVLNKKTEENINKKKDRVSDKKVQSEEGQEGLNFLANWIEVVLARLEVSVEDVFVTIRDTKVSKTSFTLHLSQATFFNTNPRMIDDRSVFLCIYILLIC
jgi:hypothetical protein